MTKRRPRGAKCFMPISCLMILFLMLSSCSDSGDSKSAITVLAAASLQSVGADLVRDFQGEHPEIEILTSYAGTQRLRMQIEHGAAADLLISANEVHVDALLDHHLVENPGEFVCNDLVIAVPTTNPAGIVDFADLNSAQRLVIAAPEVPLGDYSDQVLEAASRLQGTDWVRSVRQNVVSLELNARHVVNRVAAGDADAAIVYRSDAMSLGDRVRLVELPSELGVRATYYLAELTTSGSAARLWRDYLSSEGAQTIMREHGFSSCNDRARAEQATGAGSPSARSRADENARVGG